MARYPGAEWRPLPENNTQSRIVPTQFIIHTAVDAPGPSNIPAYFANSSVTVESHFYIYMDGRTIQMMDTTRRADANRYANTRAISVEMEDEGDPERVPFSPAQIEALLDLIRWCSTTHNIPLDLCPSPTAPGIGWHAQWGFEDPIAQTGPKNNPWSTSWGKTCPGKTRIRQIVNVIMPALKEDTMDRTEAEKTVKVLYKALLGREPDAAGLAYWTGVGEGKSRGELAWAFLSASAPELGQLRQTITGLRKDLNELQADFSDFADAHAPASGPSIDQIITEIRNRLED